MVAIDPAQTLLQSQEEHSPYPPVIPFGSE